MAVTTYALAKTQYLDNLDWEADGSVTKANLFAQACSALMVHLPAVSEGAGTRTEFKTSELRKSMNDARAFAVMNGTNRRRNLHADFSVSR